MRPSDDANLPVAMVLPRDKGDMLVRAGIERGVPRVNFYYPSATFSPVCADRSVVIDLDDGIVIDRIHALGRMTEKYILVLVTRSDSLAAVYQIDISVDPPTLTPAAVTSATSIEPVLAVGSPFVAFNELSSEIWFGGPSITKAVVTSTFSVGSTFTTVPAQPNERWYHAAATSTLTGYEFALIGQRADYSAISGAGTSITTDAGRVRGECDADLSLCPERIARTVTSGPTSVTFVPALSFTPDGKVTAVTTNGTLATMFRDVIPGVDAVLDDVALHELRDTGSSPPVDIIALVHDGAGAKHLWWLADGFLMTDISAEIAVTTGNRPERLAVGNFIPQEGPKILVLDDQPGLPDPGGSCFELVVSEGFAACKFPAR